MKAHRALLALVGAIGLSIAVAVPAFAHPLGNFTINRFSQLSLNGDRIDVMYVVDYAEIPAFQEQQRIADDAGYMDHLVRDLSHGLLLEAGAQPAPLLVVDHSVVFLPGQGGLQTMRLQIVLSVAAPAAGGRQSARETAVRVAAGAIARKWLQERYRITIRGYLAQLGPKSVPFQSWEHVAANPFFAANAAIVPELEAFMDGLRKSGDSCGARITVIADGVPVGWGEPVYGKLDADIAAAMMSINAVKGVEIGAGFSSVTQKGTEHSDEMTPKGFVSNNAGGILGGISTGQDIVVSIAVKPTSSIRLDRRSIDKSGDPVIVNTHGRHDPCVGIRATPITEAMLALVLMDHALRHRAQNADVVCTTPKIAAQAPSDVIGALRAAGAVDNPDPDEA